MVELGSIGGFARAGGGESGTTTGSNGRRSHVGAREASVEAEHRAHLVLQTGAESPIPVSPADCQRCSPESEDSRRKSRRSNRVCGGEPAAQPGTESVEPTGSISAFPFPDSASSAQNTSRATLPIAFVETTSNVAPTTPPSNGMALPMFSTPFSPNFVTSRKPTAWLMAVNVLPEMLCIALRRVWW